MTSSTQRYIAVFIITLVIFIIAFLLSNLVGGKKLEQLHFAQQEIALEILSTETRFSLLGAASCDAKVQNEDFELGLNQELNDLARRVKSLENELGRNNKTVLQLKKHYNLLQIKDYLLWQEIQRECGDQMVSLLYFHEPQCRECQRQAVVLDRLHDTYPEVRIYWFDRDLETPAMETLVEMHGITSSPSIIIDNKLIDEFISFSELENHLPEWLIEKYAPEEDKESEEDGHNEEVAEFDNEEN